MWGPRLSCAIDGPLKILTFVLSTGLGGTHYKEQLTFTVAGALRVRQGLIFGWPGEASVVCTSTQFRHLGLGSPHC